MNKHLKDERDICCGVVSPPDPDPSQDLFDLCWRLPFNSLDRR